MTELTREQQLELQRNNAIKENAALRAKLEGAKGCNDRQAEEITERRKELTQLEQKLESMERERDEWKSAAQLNAGAYEPLQQQLAAAQGRVRELESEYDFMGHTLQRANTSIDELDTERDTLTTRLSQVEEELARLKNVGA